MFIIKVFLKKMQSYLETKYRIYHLIKYGKYKIVATGQIKGNNRLLLWISI